MLSKLIYCVRCSAQYTMGKVMRAGDLHSKDYLAIIGITRIIGIIQCSHKPHHSVCFWSHTKRLQIPIPFPVSSECARPHNGAKGMLPLCSLSGFYANHFPFSVKLESSRKTIICGLSWAQSRGKIWNLLRIWAQLSLPMERKQQLQQLWPAAGPKGTALEGPELLRTDGNICPWAGELWFQIWHGRSGK